MADFNQFLCAAPSTTGEREDQTGAATASDRSGQFVAVTGPDTEQVSAPAMVIVAYGLFWLIVFAFVYSTYRSQVRLARKISELEKRLPKDANLS